jgi:hypothetical protein
MDSRWRTTNWAERPFGLDTIVEIKQVAEMEWAGKKRFLGRKKNYGELTGDIRIKPSFGIFSKMDILRYGWKDSKFKGENGI